MAEREPTDGEPISRELPEIPGEIDPKTEDVAELRNLVVARESQLAMQIDTTVQLQAKFDELSSRVDEEQTARARAEGELQQVRASFDSVIADRDQLRVQLDETRADFETRLSDTVRAALSEQAKEHEAELRQLVDERQDLRTQLDAAAAERDDLQRQLEEGGGQASTPAQSLAASFAGVVAELAEQPPAQPDKPYAVALTTMEVEAKGVLHVENDEPQLVTSRAGMDPGQLSTVRMQFRTTPRIPGTAPPADR